MAFEAEIRDSWWSIADFVGISSMQIRFPREPMM
jgi:hypothetical protein